MPIMLGFLRGIRPTRPLICFRIRNWLRRLPRRTKLGRRALAGVMLLLVDHSEALGGQGDGATECHYNIQVIGCGGCGKVVGYQ